jgi:uncharacterized integral membrane protein (TIGR00698 family)
LSATGPSRYRGVVAVLPGLLLAFAVSVVAYAIHRRFDLVSPLVVSVTIGMLLATFGRIDSAYRPGLRFSAKRVLRAGIVLLGFRLSLSELGKLGPRALVAVVFVVVATFFGTQWLARRLGLSHSLGLLMATGYSICGASAIAAVEPFADADEEEIAYAIAMVTLCGTMAIFALPALGSLMRMSPAMFGSWVGASVHDVGQVVAAASSHGSVALKYAVVVKLTRVAMLAPLLSFVAVSSRRRRGATATKGSVPPDAKRPPVLPLFVVLFLVAVAVRSAGIVPASWLPRVQVAETILLGMGLMGLGSNVDLRKLRSVGGRPLALGLSSWALVAVVSLVAVHLSAA